jgi:23S rRNA (cytosine1962-C5)-methyltransferase
MSNVAVVSARGARRWQAGHPWIFRSDLRRAPECKAGAVVVVDTAEIPLGTALWSPRSEIALRLLDSDASAALDAEWWRTRIAAALARRSQIRGNSNAFRVVFGEADALPSLICDYYAGFVVLQLLSAGLERFRAEIVAAVNSLLSPTGILARNDAAAREREGLSREVVLLAGSVPEDVEVVEYGLRWLAAPWSGQKTGGFLDQRENRAAVGSLARGSALDCFSYHGSFALHLAAKAAGVVALDSSAAALERARRNAALNGFTNIETVEANAFDYLRDADAQDASFDVIVLDPPAFAKNRAAVSGALRGYKEINLRAMRVLSPGGTLFTASCSFHVSRADFMAVLADAASDSGRRITLKEMRGQPDDHPEVLSIPETGYLKGAILEAAD